jgi:anti-anti-sigma factor
MPGPASDAHLCDLERSEGLRVLSDVQGRVPILCPVGRVDEAGLPFLRAGLAGALAMYVPPIVIVDLARVTFMDAVGSEVLAGAGRHARANGGRLFLIGTGAAGPVADNEERRSG